jgi:CDP-glycerol glycerophosphotransferase (TagB/SpsB family)
MTQNGTKVIVYPDYHIRFFKDIPGVKHVQVFHGLADKKYSFSKAVLEYDQFFIPGPQRYERYKRLGFLEKGNGILIGYPKLDRVFNNKLKREIELQKLNLDPSNKTVLYAPTWVDKAFNSSWKKFRYAVAMDIPEYINLIVKLHPNLKRYKKNEVNEYENILKERRNTVFMDFLPDIVPLMAASDLLIGDVSSVTREYLAFKKPFVFLSCKPKWLWQKQKIALWECGEVVTRVKKVRSAIEKSLENPTEYMRVIENHFSNTFYRPDGNAAKRAKKAILKLCEE